MASPPQRPAFNKPWLSYSDQVALLKSRGLTIADEAGVAAFLAHINYYRFSGYCLAFEQPHHQFISGTTFEQVRESYDFDRVLRDLVTEALELVELDFRTAIAHHFGGKHGPFGHVSAINYFTRFNHTDWLTKIHYEASRSHELFVQHFNANYSGFPDLPIWMLTEVMSFGSLSKMFKGMIRRDQREIAIRYGLQPTVLASWMHHLVYVRNLCAHHSRLWDRVWSIKPELPPGKTWSPPLLPGNNRLFATLLVLYFLLKRCPAIAPFDQEWKIRLHGHLDKPPKASKPLAKMGLTGNWEQHPNWT